eukprot:755716-Hanusia_phi.AAC.1
MATERGRGSGLARRLVCIMEEEEEEEEERRGEERRRRNVYIAVILAMPINKKVQIARINYNMS